MKKSILLLLSTAILAFAGVSQTTVGCVDKNDLKTFLTLVKNKEINSLQGFYKFAIENDCEMIDRAEKIKLLGKPSSDDIALVYVKKFDKNLYIQSNVITNKNTPDNHKFNKSF